MMNWKDYLNSLKLLTQILIKIIFITLIFLNTYSENIFAQKEINKTDTVQYDTSKFVMKKSPLGAVVRSAILPGLGQFYNESYWKIPVIWGVLGYLGYNWVTQNNEYKKYRDLFNQSINSSNPTGNTTYFKQREFYKDQRDLFAVYIGLAYLLNIIDAYVDAHLYDFDVSPYPDQNTIYFSFKINL